MGQDTIALLAKNRKSSHYKNLLLRAATTIKNGGVLVAPSDTIYGIFASAENKKAIAKIQRIKGREKDKPMPVVVGDINAAQRLAKFSPHSMRVARQLWPGPFTCIVSARRKLPRGVIAKDGSVGIRVPKSKWLQDLLDEVGVPLVATSANRSGQKEIQTILQAKKELSKSRMKPDLYIDSGITSSQPSTIIDVRVWPPIVLRGKFSVKQLRR